MRGQTVDGASDSWFVKILFASSGGSFVFLKSRNATIYWIQTSLVLHCNIGTVVWHRVTPTRC